MQIHFISNHPLRRKEKTMEQNYATTYKTSNHSDDDKLTNKNLAVPHPVFEKYKTLDINSAHNMRTDIKRYLKNEVAVCFIDDVMYTEDMKTLLDYPETKKDKAFVIPDGVETIYPFAVSHNNYLTDITIPNSVKRIGFGAFLYNKFTQLSIPSGIKIDKCAFSGRFMTSFNDLTEQVPNDITRPLIEAGYLVNDYCNRYDVQEENYYYKNSREIDGVLYSDDLTTLVKYPEDRYDETFIIPDHVVNIGKFAFSKSHIKKITIPPTVDIIGSRAFAYCKELTDVNMKYGVTLIADEAFACCSNLKTVRFPDSLKIILNRAFICCDCLESIVLPCPEQGLMVGTDAFAFCNGLKEVSIPRGSLNIVDCGVFSHCPSLEHITIPTATIDAFAFADCKNLKSVVILDTDESVFIGQEAFANCEKLEQITLPQCYALHIGIGAFSNCHSIEQITIPDTERTEIGMHAFKNCTSLKTITLGSNIDTMYDACYGVYETHYEKGTTPFYGCDSLQEINVSGKNNKYCSINGVLYTKDMEELVQYPVAKPDDTFVVPKGVRCVNRSVFDNCKTLKTIISANGTKRNVDDILGTIEERTAMKQKEEFPYLPLKINPKHSY